jgi:hypothetical protein
MAPSNSGPTFEPPRKRPDWLDDILEFAHHLAGAARSATRLIETLKGLEPADRRAAGLGAFGTTGLVAAVIANVLGIVNLPFWAFVIAAAVFQVPWVWRAIPATLADSQRRRQLHEDRREEAEGEERFKKTRRWRHERATSLVGPLRMPLETSPEVDKDMGDTVEKIETITGRPFALVLVKEVEGGLYRVVLTKGGVSDCLKAGTEWARRDMDVYEYIQERSLYPSHLIEREVVGNSEYFLVAASEIDVMGNRKEHVLDCFLEVVGHGIGRVEVHRGA